MKTQPIAVAALLAFCAQAALSQPAEPQPARPVPSPAAAEGPTIDLTALLERLGDELNREFIVDPRVPVELRVGTSRPEAAGYESLLGLLRVNQLIAVETAGDQILIVSETTARSMPSPIVQANGADISDHAVVTRVIELPPADEGTGGAGPFLIPLLRPMMSINGYLAPSADGSRLIVVDRYDNVRRITAVVRALTD